MRSTGNEWDPLVFQCQKAVLGICILPSASGIQYYFEKETSVFHTTLVDGVAAKINRSWIFVGFTYDPVTQKPYAFLNNQYTEFSLLTTSSQSNPGKSLSFGGHSPFLIDNVFYFPKFSTAEEISAIYETSMFILN